MTEYGQWSPTKGYIEQALANLSPVVSLAIDSYGFIIAASASAQKLLGAGGDGLVGTSLSRIFAPDDIEAMMLPLAEGNGESTVEGLGATLPNGGRAVMDIRASDYLRKVGLDSIFLYGWRVERREEHLQELETLALHDALTELPTRTLLRDRLQTAIGRLARGAPPVAVMFFDLRSFKAVNDMGGHEMGDLALRLVAERLTLALRPSDTVARWGGDEFVVLCEGMTGAVASEVAKRLLSEVSLPLPDRPDLPRIEASVGVALVISSETDPDAVLHAADKAMYASRDESAGVREVQIPVHLVNHS